MVEIDIDDLIEQKEAEKAAMAVAAASSVQVAAKQEIGELKTQLAFAEAQSSKISQELDEALSRIELLEDDLKASREQIAHLETDAEFLEASQRELQLHLEIMEGEKAELARERNQVPVLKEEKENLTNKLETIQIEHKEQLEALEATKEELEKKLRVFEQEKADKAKQKLERSKNRFSLSFSERGDAYLPEHMPRSRGNSPVGSLAEEEELAPIVSDSDSDEAEKEEKDGKKEDKKAGVDKEVKNAEEPKTTEKAEGAIPVTPEKTQKSEDVVRLTEELQATKQALAAMEEEKEELAKKLDKGNGDTIDNSAWIRMQLENEKEATQKEMQKNDELRQSKKRVEDENERLVLERDRLTESITNLSQVLAESQQKVLDLEGNNSNNNLSISERGGGMATSLGGTRVRRLRFNIKENWNSWQQQQQQTGQRPSHQPQEPMKVASVHGGKGNVVVSKRTMEEREYEV